MGLSAGDKLVAANLAGDFVLPKVNTPLVFIAGGIGITPFRSMIEDIVEKKLKVDMQMVEKTDLSEDGTRLAVNKLLNLKKPPDAIISFNDYVHLDAVKEAMHNGIAVNEDILFASYANITNNKHAAFPPRSFS